MSDNPAPIFKRNKSRPTRVRPPSPEAEDGGAKEDTASSAMTLMTKFKNKQKARAKPQAKLSFGQDEEVSGRESFEKFLICLWVIGWVRDSDA